MLTTDKHSSPQQDEVVFESVADHYIKGVDVIVYFTILNDTKIGTNDYIGLLRVGSTNVQECLAYAPIQFDSTTTTSETTRYGTAKFLSSALPITDDEFYQFCYIVDKRKSIGTSIPFQLNCSIDDIDLLSDSLIETSLENKILLSNNDGLIALNDHENDDLLIIHTKRMLVEEKLRQENRQLFEMNRRLEQQNEECKTKINLLDIKSNEYINKIRNEMQNLVSTHKLTLDELSKHQGLEEKIRLEYETCHNLCSEYQKEALEFAQRCRDFEDLNKQLKEEINQLNSTLSSTTKLTEDQTIKIIDLETHLSQSNEALKLANQYQFQLEQQLRDLRLTTEKYQLSMQGQLDAYAKQAAQQIDQINALESVNKLLKEELNTVKTNNSHILTITEQDKHLTDELKQKINELTEQHRLVIEQKNYELEILRKEVDASRNYQHDFMTLKNSYNEIEKRCFKHQKNELEVKKQFAVYKEFAGDLERKVQDLTERLLSGADEYKFLYRKYAALERTMDKTNQQSSQTSTVNLTILSNEPSHNVNALMTQIQNSSQLQQHEENIIEQQQQSSNEINDNTATVTTTKVAIKDEEIQACPMCYWEFPSYLTFDDKKDHIDKHFV